MGAYDVQWQRSKRFPFVLPAIGQRFPWKEFIVVKGIKLNRAKRKKRKYLFPVCVKKKKKNDASRMVQANNMIDVMV